MTGTPARAGAVWAIILTGSGAITVHQRPLDPPDQITPSQIRARLGYLRADLRPAQLAGLIGVLWLESPQPAEVIAGRVGRVDRKALDTYPDVLHAERLINDHAGRRRH